MNCVRVGLVVTGLIGVCLHAGAQQTPPIMPATTQPPLPVALTLGGTAGAAPGPMTASQAVALALKLQPNIAASAAQRRAAEGRTQQARSGLLPSVAVSGGYTHFQTIAGAGSGSSGGTGGAPSSTTTAFPGFNAQASLRQLLFDFGHTGSLVRSAEALEEAADAGVRRSASDTAFLVKQGFYLYVQAQRQVIVNEQNLANQQQHLNLANARLKAGFGLPSDVVRGETTVAAASLAVTQAQAAALDARTSLNLAIGLDPRTELATAPGNEPLPAGLNVDALVKQALLIRPEVDLAKREVDAAAALANAARTSSAPTVGATVGLSSRGASFLPGNDSLTVGAAVNWNPFDSGLTAGRIKEARANLDAAKAQLQSVSLAVTSDVAQAWLNMRAAEQRVLTSAAEVANAVEGERLATGRYKAGIGTFIDVSDAQSALLTAETDQVNSQSALNVARAALAHAVGGLKEEG